eukprot:2638370-Rhodomonas_salina.3
MKPQTPTSATGPPPPLLLSSSVPLPSHAPLRTHNLHSKGDPRQRLCPRHGAKRIKPAVRGQALGSADKRDVSARMRDLLLCRRP